MPTGSPETPRRPPPHYRPGALSAVPIMSPGVHDVRKGDFPIQRAAGSAEAAGSPRTPLAADDEPTPRQGKLILDRVYEHVFMPNFAVAVIDTPEFQRLRGLKQLGCAAYLYPGATHTRFEHSIGVAHLAGLMLKKIARRQPGLDITEADVLAVTVAGLCHDLGHGPFSHLFEAIVNKARDAKGLAHWHHEDMSVALLRRVLERVDLAKFGLDERDANLMALCIRGLKPGAPWPEADVGRPQSKRFLVDIVSNKRNGVDVDKLDYFLRDSLCCYGRATMDCSIPRLLSSCRVLEHNGEAQVCFEEKMATSLNDIFILRAKLHKYCYQHRIVKVVDCMVADALAAADDFFLVRGAGGKAVPISECVDDVEGYTRLGDWVLSAIEASPDDNLAASRAIIDRLNRRELYAVSGHALLGNYMDPLTKADLRRALLENVAAAAEQFVHRDDEATDAFVKRVGESLIIDFVRIHYGSSDSEGQPDDPINYVSFYNPKSSRRAFHLPADRLSPLLSPRAFGERNILLISRDPSLGGVIASAFDAWKAANGFRLISPVPLYNFTPSRTGVKRSRLDESQSQHRPE